VFQIDRDEFGHKTTFTLVISDWDLVRFDRLASRTDRWVVDELGKLGRPLSSYLMCLSELLRVLEVGT
jgi:hypothetical protein